MGRRLLASRLIGLYELKESLLLASEDEKTCQVRLRFETGLLRSIVGRLARSA